MVCFIKLRRRIKDSFELRIQKYGNTVKSVWLCRCEVAVSNQEVMVKKKDRLIN